jgi:hypothetical protein
MDGCSYLGLRHPENGREHQFNSSWPLIPSGVPVPIGEARWSGEEYPVANKEKVEFCV